VCGTCLKYEGRECEYPNSQGISRVKALEQKLALLEARIEDLVNPDATTPSVKLHDPYAMYHERMSTAPPQSPGRDWGAFSALGSTSDTTGLSGSPIPSLGSEVCDWRLLTSK
jgi:hypothetical protein